MAFTTKMGSITAELSSTASWLYQTELNQIVAASNPFESNRFLFWQITQH